MVGLPAVAALQTSRQPPKKAGQVVQLDAEEARKSAAEGKPRRFSWPAASR